MRPIMVLFAYVFVILGGVTLSGTNEAQAISMEEAVRLAVRENPSGRADDANLRALASELKESQTSLAPQVDIFGDVGRQRRISPTASTVSGTGGSLTSREIGIRASLLLFDGYQRANTIYRNAARLDGATFRLLATSETLALSAVEAYIDVLRHRNLVAATQSNIRRHREILSQIRERVRGGNAPVSDRIQIEERVFAAEAVAVEVQNALEDAESRFKKVVGRAPGNKMSIPNVRGLPKSKISLVSASVANNYTIKQAEKNVNEFEYSRDAARSGLMPRLSLDGRASAGEDRNGTVGDQTDLYVGLTLSWRIFDGGLTQARERTLAERGSEAEFRREIAIRDVKELAERSWSAHVNGRKRAAVLNSQLNANRRIVSSYREEYELSKRSLLDVLDAERARFNSQFQQISVAASSRFSSFRMLATMSRLASYFGIDSSTIAPQPDVEERITSDPAGIFNVTIEPLQ